LSNRDGNQKENLSGDSFSHPPVFDGGRRKAHLPEQGFR
jgi:hypothetical protein